MLELIPAGGDKVTIRINWAASGPSDRAHSNEQPVDADCAKLEELARRVAWCEEEIWESPCSEPAAGSDLERRVDQLEASLGEAIEGTLEERVAAIVERLIEEDQEEPEAAAEKVPSEPAKPSPQPEAAHKAPDETKESARGTGRIYPTPHAGVYNAGSIGQRSTGKAIFKSVGPVGDGSSIQGRRGMSSSYRRRVKARSDPYGRGYTPPKARPDRLEEWKHSTDAAASKEKGAQAAQKEAAKSAPPREEAGGAKTERCEEDRAADSKRGIASAPAGSPSADGMPASPAPEAEAEVPADVEKVTSAERPAADSSVLAPPPPPPETTGDESQLSECDGAPAAPPAKQDTSEIQLMVKPLAGPTLTLMLPDTMTVAALCSSLGGRFKIDPSAFHLCSFVGGSAPRRLPAGEQTLRAVGLAWDSVVTMKLAGPLLGGADVPKEPKPIELQRFIDFLSPAKGETNAGFLLTYAEEMCTEFSTLDALLQAQSFEEAVQASEWLTDFRDEECRPRDWKRFEAKWKAAKAKESHGSTRVCLRLLAQAAFHVYDTGEELFQPPEASLSLLFVRDVDRVRMHVHCMTTSATDKRVFVAAIRGTDNVENWLANIQATLVPADKRVVGESATAGDDAPAPMVHLAWQQIALRLLEELECALTDAQDAHLYCVGHSLGGALSLLLALAWQQRFPTSKAHAITWAAPMVGNHAFNEVCKGKFASDDGDERVVHFVNSFDVVPKTPSEALGFSAWEEARVRIDTSASSSLLQPVAAVPAAIFLLLSGRSSAGAAVKNVLNATKDQLVHMHSCTVYFHLTIVYLGERLETQAVDSNEQAGIAKVANALRAAALLHASVPRGVPAASAAAPFATGIMVAESVAHAGLAAGVANLAVSLIGQGLTISSMWRLEETVGGMHTELSKQTEHLGQMEAAILKTLDSNRAQLSSEIASASRQLSAQVGAMAGQIPQQLRDDRLEGYLVLLSGAIERLRLQLKGGASDGDIVEVLKELDQHMSQLKIWLKNDIFGIISNIAITTNAVHAPLGGTVANEKHHSVTLALMMANVECIDAITKVTTRRSRPIADYVVAGLRSTQQDMLYWLAEQHGERLWTSGDTTCALTAPHALQGCLLLSRAHTAINEARGRSSLSKTCGSTHYLDWGTAKCALRAVALDPTHRRAWLDVARPTVGPSYPWPDHLVCMHNAGALIDSDLSLVSEAASLLTEKLTEAMQSAEKLGSLKIHDWCARVVDAYYVHAFRESSAAYMPLAEPATTCIKRLVDLLVLACNNLTPEASDALTDRILRLTHQLIDNRGTPGVAPLADYLPQILELLDYLPQMILIGNHLRDGLSAMQHLCSVAIKRLSEPEGAQHATGSERINLYDQELPEHVQYDLSAMQEIVSDRSAYRPLIVDAMRLLTTTDLEAELQLDGAVVKELERREGHLKRRVTLEKLRIDFLKELRKQAPSMDCLHQLKSALDELGDVAWLSQPPWQLDTQYDQLSKSAVLTELLSQNNGHLSHCHSTLSDIVQELPKVIGTLSLSDERHRERNSRIQKLVDGVSEQRKAFTGVERSTVVFTGTTSAGKTTAISAMLCSAVEELRTTLLPTSRFENTNSVTELFLHPIATKAVASVKPVVKRTWRGRSGHAVTEHSFDKHDDLKQQLVDWQNEAHGRQELQVDSREIHLYQSRLEGEMVLIDTPGLNGTNSMVREELERIVHGRLFLCVVVINCALPMPLGNEVLGILRELAKSSQGAGTYLPPVFVFTSWDLVTKEEDKRDLKRTLERMWVELQKRDWENSGGAAVLADKMPCFFASINGREALRRFETSTDCAAGADDISFLLKFLRTYCGSLDGLRRALGAIHSTQEAVQTMTNLLFQDNTNTKPFSELTSRQLDEKAEDIKRQFENKLTERLDGLPKTADELDRNLSGYIAQGWSSLVNLHQNAKFKGPEHVDELDSNSPVDGREWTGKKTLDTWTSAWLGAPARPLDSQWLGKLLSQKKKYIYVSSWTETRDNGTVETKFHRNPPKLDGGEYSKDVEAVCHFGTDWKSLLDKNGIKLRAGSFIKIGDLYWAPEQKTRNMTKYQADLSRFFAGKFTDEFTNEIAALQKRSMDELVASIKDALDVDKLTGGASFEDGVMKYVNKVTLGALGASMVIGVGAGATVLTSSAGIFAAAGGLSATGVGIFVAVPLAAMVAGWGYYEQYGISEEVCQTRALDIFLKGLAENQNKFKTNVCNKFDEAMDGMMAKLKDFRLQTESKELRHIIENSDQERARLDKQFNKIQEELNKLDPWLCGDAELKKIVLETFGEHFG